jgi:uncharacterized protein (DUF983 family)
MPQRKTAMWRGLKGVCPACGQTHVFNGWLSVVPICVACTAPLGSYRADDAPPYIVIFLVGHLLVPLMFWVETAFHPELWIQAAFWLPVSMGVAAALLRPVKGATLGLMLTLGMVRSDDE